MPRPFIIFPHSSHSLSVRTLFGEMELNPSSHENRCEIHAWLLLFKFFWVHILLVIYGFIEQRRFHFAPFLSFTINATEIDWIVCARHTNGPLMIFLNLIEIRQEINMHHHFHPSIHWQLLSSSARPNCHFFHRPTDNSNAYLYKTNLVHLLLLLLWTKKTPWTIINITILSPRAGSHSTIIQNGPTKGIMSGFVTTESKQSSCK